MQPAVLLKCQSSLQELGGGLAAILPGILNHYPGWPDKSASFSNHSLAQRGGPSHSEAQEMRLNKSDLVARLRVMEAKKAAMQVVSKVVPMLSV